MFGSLRKKLKETVKKLSQRVSDKPDIEKLEEQAINEREHIESDAVSIESQKPVATTSQIEKEIENIGKDQEGIEEPFTEKQVDEEATEEEEESFKEPVIRESKTEPEGKIEKDLHIKKSGLWGLKEKLVKKITVKTLSEKDIDDFFEDFENDLLEANVALEVVEFLKKSLREKLVGKDLKRGKVEDEITKAFEESILNTLKQEPIDIEDIIKKAKAEGRPALFVFLGFNGVGKTTTLAKLGYYLKEKGYKVVFAAADTYRAASEEQIEYHANKIGVTLIKHQYGADPAAVIFDAVKHGKAKGVDCILADTAGRSHSNVNLTDELKKICRVNKPDLNILVLDSLSGNDIISQCEKFDQAVGVHGMILTKLDVDEKGGAVMSASYTTKKPILFLGTGQEYDDFELFDPRKFVKNLLE